MKTAMEELIDKIEYIAGVNSKDDNVNYKIIHQILYAANTALEKEKEQIINGHWAGWSDAYDYLKKDNNDRARQAEEYYNQTYNQKQHIIDIMKADEDDGLYNQNI